MSMKRIVFGCYIIFLFLFVAFSYLFIDPGLFYLRPLFTNYFQLHRVLTTILFCLFLLISFAFYGYCLYLVEKKKLSLKDFFITLSVTIGILLFSYPAMVSFDIFNYIATAKVAFLYHENPYILMPIEFPNDPLLLFMHAANKTALYAPIWILLTAIPHIAGFGNFLITLFFFKVLVVLFFVATLFLMWHMEKSLKQLVWFGLNPLVIFEIVVGGHNDSVMMFLILLSIFFFFKSQKGKSMLFFILSVGIKYATIVTAPLFVIGIFKKISQPTFFLWTTILMYIIFFLSPIREEIYPWYALWFLVPVSFIENKFLKWISLTFSFSLLLRYIPFMLLGTYFGPTPILKETLTFIPVLCVCVYYIIFKKRHI